MIDSFDLYNSFKSFVNTYQGGWFRPQSDFIIAVNDISKKLWVKWTREAEKSQEVRDNLFPFLRSKNMIVNAKGVYGTFNAPKEYGRYAAARIIVNGSNCIPDNNVEEGKCDNGDFKTQDERTDEYYDKTKQFTVEMIDNQRWGSVNEHLTKGPTLKNPKIRQIENKFEVAPRKVSVIVLDYYIEPKEATFKYTITSGNVQTGAGDQIVYDKANSTPLEWPTTVRDEFLIALGERYGLFTRDAFVSQITSQQKQTA